ADNGDSLSVQRRGHWKPATRGGYGPDFLVHEPDDQIAYVRFAPEIPEAGSYAGYIYFPKAEGMSKQTLVIVNDGERNHGMAIRESDIRVEGQTSGEWVSLGTYRLPAGQNSYVQVSSKDADGKVIADAVIWVPVDRSATR
ncbi:MAG TPA: xanthan lyase, partial [Cyclobacteriaceae bacterium]|nr:xanthan lyase [Cyclobacteriaceae bacterium]